MFEPVVSSPCGCNASVKFLVSVLLQPEGSSEDFDAGLVFVGSREDGGLVVM